MTRTSNWRLSRAAISAIERGQNFPGMEAMLALSNVLYVDPKELMERARLATAAPIDVTGLDYDELDRRAREFFWAGDFRRSLSVYDAMLEKLILESPREVHVGARLMATLEVRRSTVLKRAGALLSAIATAERAIWLSTDYPEVQAKAYVSLAGLQTQRGNLPLADDAARRAVELSQQVGDPECLGWAWMVKAKVLYMSAKYEEARQAFVEAHKEARLAADNLHLTHIEGDIGMCWLALGRLPEAEKWVRRAIELSRKYKQPALEASWLVEMGKIALEERKLERADSHASAALRIAKPREHNVTIFRAEWLRHRVVRQAEPANEDRHRLHYLRKLFQQLDQHEGIEEVQEFKKTAMRILAAENRTTR